MGSYYETIDGARCDRAVIDSCREGVAGKGDGRISVEDAKKVYETLADGGKLTRTERWTFYYCLMHFKWTAAAHDWIIDALKEVVEEDQDAEPAAKKAKTEGASYYETIDGMKCDRAIVDACRDAIAGRGDGRVSLEDAKMVWEKALDGGKVTRRERWTLRYCLKEFN